MENTLLLILGLTLLIIGAEILVKGASSIALSLKISPLVVGLTVVASGTSAPELFVSIKSALNGSPDIAFGNVVGSNICNLALVLGVTAMIFPVNVDKEIIGFNWPVAFLASVLLYVLTLDHNVNFWEGCLFVALIFLYNFLLIRMSRKATKDQISKGNMEEKPIDFFIIVKDVLYIVVGSVGLLFGSEWLVQGAENIAFNFGISQRLVGISIVAVGTSLPELTTSVIAAFRKNSDMGLGNLVGSNIFNILCILGFTGIIKEIHVDEFFSEYDIFWVIGVTAILYPLMKSRSRISRIEGAFLVLIYFAYLATLFIWNIH